MKQIADAYHDLKLIQKLGLGNTGYHSANYVVPNGDITSILDNLAMDVTAEQSHVEQLMAIIHQLMDTSKILGEQLKQIAKTKAFLDRQGQEDKKTTNNKYSYLEKLIQP